MKKTKKMAQLRNRIVVLVIVKAAVISHLHHIAVQVIQAVNKAILHLIQVKALVVLIVRLAPHLIAAVVWLIVTLIAQVEVRAQAEAQVQVGALDHRLIKWNDKYKNSFIYEVYSP